MSDFGELYSDCDFFTRNRDCGPGGLCSNLLGGTGAVCTKQCESDAECAPAPCPDGAAPICQGGCQLPCTEDTDCPEGMNCFSIYCGWAI